MLYNYKTLSTSQRILYRQLFQKDFYSFVKEFWNVCDPAPFIDGKLIQFYCEYFQYVCRPWLGYDGPEKEIIMPKPIDGETWEDIEIIDVRQNKQNGNINIPPRHTKSVIFSQMAPCWLSINLPIKAASISHTQGLALSMNMGRQRIFHSEKFQFFFPEIVLTTDKTDKLIDSRGTELYAMPRETMTGYGADVIICDDLTTAAAARKDKEEMNNAWSFFQDTLPSRINNPNKYIIFNIQQRLAPNDITGRILNDEKLSRQFTHVVLPAQFSKHTYLICPISGDVIEYKKDDYLWPERFGDYSTVRNLVGETVWQTQFLQNPIASDKTIIKEDMLIEKDCTEVPGYDVSNNTIDLSADGVIVYGSHDFAVKDKQSNDFTGTLLAYKVKKTIYIVDGAEVRQNFTRQKQYLINLDTIYPGIRNIIEDKANGSPLMTELQNEVPGCIAWNPRSMDKIERMTYASDYVQSGNVVLVRTKWDDVQKKYVLSEGLLTLKQRLIAFPLVQHDDICDAFSMLILYIFQNYKFSVYRNSFNDLNIVQNCEYDYTTTFFNRDGDTYKVLEIGIKYGIISMITVTKELTFKSNITDAFKKLKEFTPDKNVFIDSSKDETMTGVYDENTDIVIERYAPDNYDESVVLLNKAFSNKKVVVDQKCKNTIADIEDVLYDEKNVGQLKTVRDGFVACIRTALNYYGDL